MRSRVTKCDGALQILIPNPRFNPLVLIEFLIPVAIIAFVGPSVLQFFRQTDTPDTVQAVVICFILLFFAALPLLNVVRAFISARKGRTVVTVTPRALVIEQYGAYRGQSRRLEAGDILGIDYGTVSTQLAAVHSTGQDLVRQQSQGDGAIRASDAIEEWTPRLRRFLASSGITVKSKSGLFSFAAGLPDAEVAYLYQRVIAALGDGEKR